MERLKKIVAFIPMWTCYWVGEWISCLFKYDIPLIGSIYPVYNQCMIWSHNLDYWADMGLWKKNTSNESEI